MVGAVASCGVGAAVVDGAGPVVVDGTGPVVVDEAGTAVTNGAGAAAADEPVAVAAGREGPDVEGLGAVDGPGAVDGSGAVDELRVPAAGVGVLGLLVVLDWLDMFMLMLRLVFPGTRKLLGIAAGSGLATGAVPDSGTATPGAIE